MLAKVSSPGTACRLREPVRRACKNGVWQAMKAKLGIREGAVSGVVFVIVLFGLVSIDPRVRDRMTDLFMSGGVTPWGDRVGDLAGALWSALRTQSIENAPALVFVTVGTVLTLVMLRS